MTNFFAGLEGGIQRFIVYFSHALLVVSTEVIYWYLVALQAHPHMIIGQK